MKKIDGKDRRYEYFLRNVAFLFSVMHFQVVLPFITFFQTVNSLLCSRIKLLELCTERLNKI